MTGVVVVVLICDFLASKTASLGLPLFFGGSGYVGSGSGYAGSGSGYTSFD